MPIRAATESDAEAIAEIYNDAVLNTTAIWNESKVDFLNRIKWMRDRREAGFPVIVFVGGNDSVLVYASYGDWRPWDGYRHT
ncbi:L-amino acid N-acyltransferase YncA [Pantoea dispersa]|jgi:L-amino acid N-acyltransferase|nr:L-amino acid N-acyltransferase YncA [Pantoea dispersa]